MMPWMAKLACSDRDYVKFIVATLGHELCQEVFRLSLKIPTNGTEAGKGEVMESETT